MPGPPRSGGLAKRWVSRRERERLAARSIRHWTFLLEVPTGAVADFFGRKWSLVLGALTTALASLVYASTPRFEVFLGAEIVFALGYTLVSGADEALLYDSLVASGREADTGRQIARLHAAQLLGLVTGALTGS